MAGKPPLQSAPKKCRFLAWRWLGLGVFSLALLVRGVYLAESWDNPTFRTPIVDSQTYDGLARRLAAGQPVTSEFFWQPVFYPTFLALVFRLSHSSILWAKIIQAILGAFTALLTYQLGRRILGRAAAVGAGVLVAIYMPLVFFETELLASGWAAFWMAAIALLLFKTREKAKPLPCLALGFSGALSILTRPEFLPVFGAGCLWLLVAWAREHPNPARLFSRFVFIALGFSLIAGPLAIWSHRVLGRAMMLPSSGGINLYIGNNPDYERTITARPGLDWQELTAAPARQGIVDDLGMQRYFLNKTKEYIKGQPLSFLYGLFHKTTQFFSSREIPRNTDIYLFGRWSRSLRWLVWKAGPFGFPFGLLLPAAFLGLVFCWRKIPGPVLLSLLLYPAAMIMVFVTSRYRVPLVPLLSILAAGGVGAVWDMKRERQWKKLAVAAAVALTVGVAGSSAGPFPEERLNYEAELYYGLGSTYDAWGKVKEAETAYGKALEVKPDYAEAHYNLANIRKTQGRLEEAIGHYGRALQARPGSVEIRNNLGAALKALGRTEQAIEQWDKAVALTPTDPFAHFNLALALAEQRKFDLSLGHAEEALRQRPDWVEIRIDLGMILLQQGEIDRALAQFNEALRINPASAEAHSGLGIVLGSRGDLDAAVDHFRRAIALEPGRAEARYNLGHALLLQGKRADAIAEFERLLQIDPAHAQGRLELESARAEQMRER
ncbi:MAG: putative O-linked GlcNAc transferase-putative TPR-containing transrane protein [Candidatus Aminicenantes bacterium]|nr:putative O-linked GlcNAc transferase-putative TPR-containing transrane protein [Candidatus Aminicenantes bacterium]